MLMEGVTHRRSYWKIIVLIRGVIITSLSLKPRKYARYNDLHLYLLLYPSNSIILCGITICTSFWRALKTMLIKMGLIWLLNPSNRVKIRGITICTT